MKNRLEKKINLVLSLLSIIVLLPLIVTIVCQEMRLEHLMKRLPLEQVLPSDLSAAATEYVEMVSESIGAGETEAGVPGESESAEKTVDNVEKKPEEKVTGIVAKQIKAGSSTQAILAQCVIARTSLYDAMRTHTAEPDSLSGDEMRELWGENYERIYQSLKECAEQTEGEVLTYQGQYIYAAYHAVSAGKTRTMSELYENTDMPYLVECPCPEDTAADGYLTVQYWEREKFLENCRTLFPESPPETMGQIKIVSRDSAGYVKEIAVGSGTYSGEEFRVRCKLSSACFAVTEDGGQVRIVTKGLGHGFGLSQYTAELMAAEGKSYKEILTYFYPGAELSNVSEN